MNPLSMIGASYIRWRHSHGFGVHSPFAYDLVTKAVRPGNYGYYGYEEIDHAILTGEGTRYSKLRHDARLLLRLMAALDCRRLLQSVTPHPVFEAAARGIHGISAPLTPHAGDLRKGDIVLARGRGLSAGEIRHILDRGVPMLALDPDDDMAAAMISSISRGTVFIGTRIVLCVPREEMALASYLMKF